MIEQERTGLDFEALRHATEKRELDFYADDAQAIILNADAPFSPAFELVGKAENSKYLGTAFSQKASHSIEGEVVREDLVEYREVCEYPDGTRVGVATAPARTNRHEVRVTS